ncbi:hypothetical protein L873DRAFT_1810783 [Choiromyces venosus 120613-1]|uniref:Uncharacterized protein n=1 Tax=Choiromyces venosus 120613-1 TaxID=1336337 RepID=A0A3N4JJ52_9PEZI|nr:hypothetical protein L873DRAFT_1810783 [Choiromyces venosus 120613-1]
MAEPAWNVSQAFLCAVGEHSSHYSYLDTGKYPEGGSQIGPCPPFPFAKFLVALWHFSELLLLVE